jgi:hypothetical protein
MFRRILFGVVLFVIAAIGVGYFVLGIGAQNETGKHGRFIGSVVAEWKSNGRDMRLVQDFAYIDPKEGIWLAPKDSEVNGASIPRAFWTMIGGPFEGKYRNASVVHDVACVEKKRPHKEVHRAFYEACLCGGVDERMARILYAAVAKFGPTWAYKSEEHEEASTVTKYVEEQQTRIIRDSVTGEERTETFTVNRPVSEMVVRKVIRRVPVPIFRDEATEGDVRDVVKLIDEEKASLDTIGSLGNLPVGENSTPMPTTPDQPTDEAAPAPSPGE